MVNGPFDSMMSQAWLMGPEWAIARLAVMMIATAALVVVTHVRRSVTEHVG
jgi:hypothetical protein